MNKDYQSKLFRFITTIQKDLNENKINQQQYKLLLGFFLSTEISDFVKREINRMLPENDDIHNMTLISYKRNRNFNHAR